MQITRDVIDQITQPNKISSTAIALKGSLKLFIATFHFHIYGRNFIFKPFHEEIIKELQAIVFGEGDKKNLIINLIPRYGKSSIVQYFTAWGFALNPKSNFIYTSYSDNLVLGFSDRIRQVMTSDLFEKLYGLEFSKTEDSKRKWAIKEGGGMYAASQGGAITGFGAGDIGDDYAGALIIDDPIKPEDARSELMREKAISYFEETLANRLNNPQKTPIIIIMQRLHLNDLCGHLIENEKENWNVLTYPAYNEDTQECIWPEKHDAKFFESLRVRNPYYFYSQFQQQPIAGGNAIFRKEWFNYYDNLPDLDRIVQSWDTAFKKGAMNDYSVCSTWGIVNTQFGDKYYLIDIFRGRIDYPELKKKFIELQSKYNPYQILVEDKASGQSLIQDLKKDGNSRLHPVKVDSDKETRASATTGLFDNGCVFFPRESNFINSLMGEMMQFPNSKHDDQVDSVVQFLNWANKPKQKVQAFSF